MPPKKGYTLFNDSIHGSIKLHPLCVSIIDTPQFQRLRYIKQLTLCYFVYPGACHNRFEHSIGTCHLATVMIETLKNNQPELNISDQDIRCVEIAGLCRVLGHGPFSHVFEDFIKLFREHWTHEKASEDMFDHLLVENPKVKETFEDYKLNEVDKTFIKKLINPTDDLDKNLEGTGRTKKKAFLFDIISNKSNGIGVDKWDYFARDCHHLGFKNSFDHLRIMKFAKVLTTVNNRPEICYRDKVAEHFHNMFHLRRFLHKNAYQHKVVKCISAMLLDSLLLADNHLKRESRCLSESIDDMEAYSKFTDNIFEEILYSPSADLNASKSILQRIISRDLYDTVGQYHWPKVLDRENDNTIRDEIASQPLDEGDPKELKEQLVICQITLDYGFKSQDPIKKIYFYQKYSDAPKILKQHQISHMLPETFSETFVYAFLKDNKLLAKAKKRFETWTEEKEKEKEEEEEKIEQERFEKWKKDKEEKEKKIKQQKTLNSNP